MSDHFIQQNIPNGWQNYILSDLCDSLDNKRIPITKSERVTGNIPYYGATGIIDYVDGYIFDEEILLIGEDGADWLPYASKAFIVQGKSWVNNHAHVLKCKKNTTHNYLEQYLNWRNLDIYTTGGTRKKLNKEVLMNIVICLPESKKEQQKIAEILGAVDEDIAKTQELIEATEKLKRGLMQELLSFKDKEDVKYLALGDIGKVSMCKRIFREETTSMGDIPFYKIGTFGKKADAFISKDLFKHYQNKFSFPKIGDILLSASGTIGRKVIYDGKPAYFQDSNIIWLEHDESKILNSFLFYLYEIIVWQTEGSTIKRLYNSILLKKIVPVPSLNEQKRVVNILSSIDEKIAVNKKLKEKLILLKKGLMQDLLSGRVRVNI